jgi:hypothetical protein
MHPDAFFEIFNLGIPWYLLALAYASVDYAFNLIMCRLCGGISVASSNFQNAPGRAIFTREFWRSAKEKFVAGGRELTKDFFADKLSWSWPLTVLAIPTVFFGFSREIIQRSILSLQSIGVTVQEYFLTSNLSGVQYILWGIAFAISMGTFYRYQRKRSHSTWFSKFWPFNFLRTLFFDFPLAYMALSTVLVWLEFTVAIYKVLSDSTINYQPLYPDLMYGLKATHTTVLGMGIFLTILSFLPTIMLIRERTENYSKMYFVLMYGGILTLFIILGALVLKFDQRLDMIQNMALTSIQASLSDPINSADAQSAARLEYFSIVANLPGHFPIPSWLNLLLSARSIAFIFELIRIGSPATTQSAVLRILEKLLGG